MNIKLEDEPANFFCFGLFIYQEFDAHQNFVILFMVQTKKHPDEFCIGMSETSGVHRDESNSYFLKDDATDQGKKAESDMT